MRKGFEITFARAVDGGYRFEGRTTAVEAGQPWSAEYAIVVDSAWVSRTAEVTELSSQGSHRVALEHDGAGHWRVNGEAAPALEGCVDIDLEASALTNALAVHRLALEVGEDARAIAACVSAPGLRVAALDQRYERRPDAEGERRFAYSAPALDFAAELSYDASGLVADYPGLAERVL